MAIETSQLSIQVKSQGIVEATKALDELSKAAGSVDKETRGFILSMGKASQENSKAAIASAKLQTELLRQDQITTKIAATTQSAELAQARAAEAAIARQQKVTEQAERAAEKQAAAEARAAALDEAKIQRMGRLQSQAEAMNKKFDEKAEKLDKVNARGNVYVNTLRSMATAASGYLGVNFVRGIVEQADAWGMMQSKLSLALGSMSQAKVIQQDLFNISQAIRVPLEDTIKLYTRMSVPMQKLGKTSSDTKAVVESFSTALQLAGATGQEASSAMLQFSQSLNAGRLNGGEFNSVAEAAPNVLRAIEKELVRVGLGAELSSKGLKKLASDGKITTEVLTEALLRASPQWKKDFESLPLTFDGAMTRLKNAWMKAVGEIGQDTGFNKRLAESLKKIEDMLPSIAKAVGEAFVFLVDNAGKFVTLLEYMIAATVISKITAFGVAAFELAKNIRLAATAAEGLKVGLLAVGATPVGAIITAIGLAGYYMYNVFKDLNKTTDKTIENQKAIANSGNLLTAMKEETLELMRQADAARAKIGLPAMYAKEINSVSTSYKEQAARIKETDAATESLMIAEKKILDYKKRNRLDTDYYVPKNMKDELQSAKDRVDAIKKVNDEAYKESEKQADAAGVAAAARRGQERQKMIEDARLAARSTNQIAADARKEQYAKLKEDAEKYELPANTIQERKIKIERDYQEALEKTKELKETTMPTELWKEILDAEAEAIKKLEAAQLKQAQSIEDQIGATQHEINKTNELISSLQSKGETLVDVAIKEAKVAQQSKENTLEQVILLQQYIDKLNELKKAKGIEATQKSAKDAQDSLDKFLDDSKVDKFSEALKSGLKGAASAFSPLIKAIDTFSAKQATLVDQYKNLDDAKKKANATDDDRIKWTKQEAELERKEVAYKLSSFGDLASASKGFFKERTEGYKAMNTIEKIFRATELFETLRNYATKSSLLTAFTGLFVTSKATETAVDTGATATSIANSGARATADGIAGVAKAIASMPFPLNIAAGAATVAALMAIGVKLTGGVGNGAVDMSKQRQEAAGTGSVLGNGNAKSESFLKSLEYIGKVSDNQLSHTISMDNSLKTIVSNISGLSNLVVKAGGGDLAAKGIKEGTETNGLVLGVAGDLLTKYVPFIGNLMNKLFGTTTKVLDQGIVGSKQTFSDILKSGVSASSYADVNTTKKFLGMTYSDKTKQTTAALPSDVTSQFTMVVKSIADGVTSAAGMIGITGSAFTDKLNSFVVDIGNISTKGLTGDQIQKQFETVFSKIGDDMAKWTVTGLEPFQKIGEGAFETLIRVSTNLTAVNDVFANLKLKTFELSLAGAKSSEAIVALAGSLDNFKQVTSSYYENFYSEAERSKTTLNSLSEIFKTMGYEQLPATRDEFRKLVEQASELGDSTKAYKLMQLSDAFASVIKQTEDLANVVTDASTIRELEIKIMEMSGDAAGATAARRQIELSQLDATGKALQNRIYALSDEQAAIQDAKQVQEEYAALVQRQAEAAAQLASKRFDLEIQILNLTGNSVEATRLQREKELSSMDASLQGLQSRIYALQDEKTASDAAIAAQKELQALNDSVQKQIDQLVNATLPLEVQRANELKGLDASTVALKKRLFALQDEAEAAKKLQTAVEAKDDSMSQMLGRMALDLEATAKNLHEAADKMKALRDDILLDNATGLPPEMRLALIQQKIDNAKPEDIPSLTNSYLKVLSETTTDLAQYQKGALSVAAKYDLQAKELDDKGTAANSKEAYEGLRAFAEALSGQTAYAQQMKEYNAKFAELADAVKSGSITGREYLQKMAALEIPVDGSHADGLDYVPFDGYVAELHKGERVQTASQAQSSDDVAGLLRQLIQNSQAENLTIAKNTAETSRILSRWNSDGQPEVRTWVAG